MDYDEYVFYVYQRLKFNVSPCMQEVADTYQVPLIEVSAKDGTNVELAFITLVALVQVKVKNLEHPIMRVLT